jgi:hypothetical protein
LVYSSDVGPFEGITETPHRLPLKLSAMDPQRRIR